MAANHFYRSGDRIHFPGYLVGKPGQSLQATVQQMYTKKEVIALVDGELVARRFPIHDVRPVEAAK